MMRRNKTPSSRASQGGFSLIELGIVIAVVAIMALLLWSRYSRVQGGSKVNEEAAAFGQMMGDVRTRFAQQGDYAGVTAKALIDNGIVPDIMVKGTGATATITSGWNTPITVAPSTFTATNDAVAFSYTVPRSSCADFVTGAASASAKVTVGTTVVKNVPSNVSNVNAVALGTACDASSAGTVVVKLEQGR